MSIRMKRKLFSLAALGCSALVASAQSPELIVPHTGVLKIQTKKSEEKKEQPEPKAETQPAPATQPPAQPPLTFPAAAGAGAAAPLAASGSSVQMTALPPVYGDMMSGNYFSPLALYNPFLVATLPGGTMQNVNPGAIEQFPLGTTFSQQVPVQIVQVQVGTEIIFDPQNPDLPIEVPIFENRLQVTGPPLQAHAGGIPVTVARGAFKIGENESPRPVDRFYVNYNFFSDVNPSLNVPGMPTTNVHRQTIGLEKTFMGGNASVGLRLPFLQIDGPQNIDRNTLGDLTMIFKYAWINEFLVDPDGTIRPGNVLSGGLVVTAPTGGAATYSALTPEIHPTMLQPWLGGIYVRGNAYLQGFSSLAVPTDDRDTTFFFNSLQVGYLFYRSTDSILTAVAPIAEVHVTTPLNNRELRRLPIGAADIVSLTGGTTFCLGSRSALNLGVNVPVTGPRPYVVEAVAQLNIRY